MKKVIIVIIGLVAVGLVAFKLFDNKELMAEKALLAEELSEKIPVEIESVMSKKLASNKTVIGTFEAITDLTMLSQTDGLVIKVFHQKGDYVKKGDLLAQVENDLIATNLQVAQASLDKNNADLERFIKLSDENAITKRQLEDIKLATTNAEAQYKALKKQYDETFIRATATGTINEDYIQLGSNIGRKTKLYDIVDISKLKLNVKITAANILDINVGDKINISSDIYPNQKYVGEVISIANKADNSLKYNVEILLDNASSTKPLKAGMFAKAHFEFTENDEALYISRDALAGSIKEPTVFVVNNGTAKLVDIKIGEVLDSEIQVLNGLNKGDKVVVNGQINLKDGTKVSLINN